MANAQGAVVVQGLAEFRAAVRRAAGEAPKLLTLGLKRAGVPILAQAAASAPRRTGALAGSYTTAVKGARADIVSRVPYGGGAEWGTRGKWAGFAKYGGPPRFVFPAVEAQQDVVASILLHELETVVGIEGWAR